MATPTFPCSRPLARWPFPTATIVIERLLVCGVPVRLLRLLEYRTRSPPFEDDCQRLRGAQQELETFASATLLFVASLFSISSCPLYRSYLPGSSCFCWTAQQYPVRVQKRQLDCYIAGLHRWLPSGNIVQGYAILICPSPLAPHAVFCVFSRSSEPGKESVLCSSCCCRV